MFLSIRINGRWENDAVAVSGVDDHSQSVVRWSPLDITYGKGVRPRLFNPNCTTMIVRNMRFYRYCPKLGNARTNYKHEACFPPRLKIEAGVMAQAS